MKIYLLIQCIICIKFMNLVNVQQNARILKLMKGHLQISFYNLLLIQDVSEILNEEMKKLDK
jgi:hypothetical protein